MTTTKHPAQLAEEYVNSQIEAHPRQFPEWSSTDVEIAWYAGYEAREEEVTALKQRIKELESVIK